MPLLRVLLIVIFFSVGAAPVAAQSAGGSGTPGWQDSLRSYVTSKSHEERIIDIVKLYEEDRRGSCSRLEFIRMLPLPLAPVSFDLSGEPRDGSWLMKVFVRRCGEQVIHNVLFEATGGRISAKGMLPGETRSSYATQTTIARKLIDYVQAERPPAPNCSELVVMTTRIAAAPIRNGPAEEWREEWTTQRCGRMDTVMIDFRAVRGRLENFRFSG